MAYRKPGVIVDKDLAEGVYAASGATAGEPSITWIKSGSTVDEYEGGSTKLNQDFIITVTGDTSAYSAIVFRFSCDLKYAWGSPMGKLNGAMNSKEFRWDLSEGVPTLLTAQSYYEQNPAVDIISAEFE